MINNGERINVKNLLVEERPKKPAVPVEGQPFDVVDILDARDFEQMLGYFGNLNELNKIELVFNLSLLNPEKNYSALIADDFLEANTHTPHIAVQYIGYFNHLELGEPKIKIEPPLVEEEYETAVKTLAESDFPDRSTLRNLAFIKLLKPGVVEKELGSRLLDVDPNSFNARRGVGSQMRLIYWDKGRDEEIFKQCLIDNWFWEEAKRHIESLKREDAWDLVAEVAADLRILAAHEIDVRDGKIELIMDKPLAESEPLPLPQARRF